MVLKVRQNNISFIDNDFPIKLRVKFLKDLFHKKLRKTPIFIFHAMWTKITLLERCSRIPCKTNVVIAGTCAKIFFYKSLSLNSL